MIKVSPSILSADFARLGDGCRMATDAGADMLHIDVMDGHFVPNITIGIPVVKALRSVSDNYFDVHLMISDPAKYAEQFCNAGADMLTFHLECYDDEKKIMELINTIKSCGKQVGISIKPATPRRAVLPYVPHIDMVLVMSVEPGFGGQKFMPESLEKIKAVREYATQIGKTDFMVEVDGGINAQTGALVKNAGADVLVAGSYVFGADDMAAAIANLKG